jgi:deoxyadenosine/deoxycytidine kinase
MQDSYLEKIQTGYFDYFKTNLKTPILIMDTQNIDFVNNQNDYHKIIQLIHQDFPKGLQRISLS